MQMTVWKGEGICGWQRNIGKHEYAICCQFGSFIQLNLKNVITQRMNRFGGQKFQDDSITSSKTQKWLGGLKKKKK